MTEQELQELIYYGQGDSEPEKALQWLNNTLESRVEYETEHKDSGDDYAQLVMDSWEYNNIDDSIWSYCLNNPELFGSMAGLEKDVLGREVYEAFFMRTYWSEWHTFSPSDGLCLLQVPVSELEIEVNQYQAESEGQPWEVVKRVAPYTEHYLGKTCEDSLLYYACPNTSWCAVISDAKLIEILNELRECKQ